MSTSLKIKQPEKVTSGTITITARNKQSTIIYPATIKVNLAESDDLLVTNKTCGSVQKFSIPENSRSTVSIKLFGATKTPSVDKVFPPQYKTYLRLKEGQLSIVKPLNYEEVREVYVVIRATNCSAVVKITVRNENDSPPKFTKSLIGQIVSYSSFVEISATDDDDDQITYRIEDSLVPFEIQGVDSKIGKSTNE